MSKEIATCFFIVVFATLVEYERHLAELEENIRIVHVNIFAHELVKLKEI